MTDAPSPREYPTRPWVGIGVIALRGEQTRRQLSNGEVAELLLQHGDDWMNVDAS